MRFPFAPALTVVTIVLASCGDDDVGRPVDAGSARDAALVEGGVVPADASASDAGTDAAVASDGGSVSPACLTGCDPRVPSSCGEDAGLCALHDREAECVMALGELALGEVCAGEEACGGGLACWGQGSSGEGVCGRICCPGERGACGDEREVDCASGAMLVTGVAPAWGRCGPVRTCDVLAPACGPGEGCYIETDPPRAVCRWAGTRGVGEACAAARDCLPGFFCSGVTSQTCVRVCRIDDPASCPTAEGRCVAQAYSPPGSGVCVASAARM